MESQNNVSSVIARPWWSDLGIGLFFVAVLIGGKLAFEKTHMGRDFEDFTYAQIQRRLIPSGIEGPPEALVISMSNLARQPHTTQPPGGRIPEPGEVDYTPREPLTEILRTLVSGKEKPLAIGVDIDFSSFGDKPVHADDPKFFADCLELKRTTGVPIYLGVFRKQEGTPKDWLGDAQFSELAVSLAIPDNAQWLPAWLKHSSSDQKLVGMGYALGRAFSAKGERKSPGWLHWWAEQAVEQEPEPHLHVAEYLVDYGPLRRLQESEHLEDHRTGAIDAIRQRLKGRIVIIGDTKRGITTDYFCIPGVSRQAVPGAFLHTCGALTFRRGALWHLTHSGRIALDVIFSVAVLGGVTLLARRYSGLDHAGTVNLHFLHSALTGIAILVVVIVGYMLVKVTRIVWSDFLLVALALLIHSPAHHGIEGFFRGFRELWRARVYLLGQRGASEHEG